MTKTLSVPVCIMGAGPVGGTLACRLAKAGVEVALIDHAHLPTMEQAAFDGRAYAVAAGSRGFLEDAGLWNDLDVPPNPILDIRVSDGLVGRTASRLHLHFDHRESGTEPRIFGWMVEARSLRKALNRQFPRQAKVNLFAPAKTHVTRTDDAVTVKVEDGPTIIAELVIGAEGRQSPLRQQAEIGMTRIPYHQTAIVCAVAHDLPHHGVALEHFLPSGPFAALPMGPSLDAIPGGASNISAIVWTERSMNAGTIMDLDDLRFAREVRRRLGSHLGSIRAIGRRWSYALSARIAHRYIDRRLALAGDAAHGIHPIAGQGLNLGFRDGIALADLIVDATRAGIDVGSGVLLARYQTLRMSDNMLMFAMTDRLDRLFSNESRGLRLARDIGIGTVNHLIPIKRLFMRHAMGVASATG